MTEPYRLMGQNGSPYSMKMRAILRYRRIPHVWDQQMPMRAPETEHVRPKVMPMMRFPSDGEWRVDSTPMAMELEEAESGRSILPEDPVHRFLSHLIEDMADEWLTKAMFHYRWYYERSRNFASYWIASDNTPSGEGAMGKREKFAKDICARQVGRMALVGCTEENKPVIEASFQSILHALESRVGYRSFLFGTRPSLGDFGLFGQLKTLADDPDPRDVIAREAPTAFHWIRHMDDLSGLEGNWLKPDCPLPGAVTQLLRVCGEAYLPFLHANRDALENGAEEVRLQIYGRTYAQAPFRYQAKCLGRLESLYAGLGESTRTRLDPLLEKTGCLNWLKAA
ncbi:MAG: glutathione S-transferase N-terminal domain-containing protein [Minwuia sp.]|uniref:glutathione S-transferase N-terminal domain-containing protein n=1 Tax=Minwuia sp. TaxID=2493630 RepID=UPI003A8AB3FF